MLERILKLYTLYMISDVRSPMPHLFGPPGCGKSTVVEDAARLLGVNMHILNVSRMSPLDVEGVQMPHTVGEEMALRLLTATWWTQIEEGDIVLLDEFLRGFPEVYNSLLDILTSRRVGAFVLPKVFIIGASNSTVSYDQALEDRLLHLPVPDPRSNRKVKSDMAERFVDTVGLLPDMGTSMEMTDVLDHEVLPMFDVLDNLGRGSSPMGTKGRSLRNLVGQVKMREIQSSHLLSLINMNNVHALRQKKWQYLVLPSGANIAPDTVHQLKAIRHNPKLTSIQKINVETNLQLIEMESALKAQGKVGITDDDQVFFDD